MNDACWSGAGDGRRVLTIGLGRAGPATSNIRRFTLLIQVQWYGDLYVSMLFMLVNFVREKGLMMIFTLLTVRLVDAAFIGIVENRILLAL